MSELDHANAWTSGSGNLCIPTTDGRHFSVNGRLWRMSDPRLSEERNAELRKQLMTGMRMKAQGSEEKGKAVVHDAKLRLGERGTPWWELDRPYDVEHRSPRLPRRPNLPSAPRRGGGELDALRA